MLSKVRASEGFLGTTSEGAIYDYTACGFKQDRVLHFIATV